MEGLTQFLSDNSIYIVLIIVLLVWGGIFFFLLSIDKRIKTIQKEVRIEEDEE